jgi:hypothetical protein
MATGHDRAWIGWRSDKPGCTGRFNLHPCGTSRGPRDEGKKPRFPPSLNAVKSEYKIFCDSYGGPIICDDRFAKIKFEYCCREFPRQMFDRRLNAGRRIRIMEFVIGRSWPMQRASTHFDNESLRSTEPKHRSHRFRELLDEIRKSARRLSRALVQLQKMSARQGDGTTPAD